MKVITVMLVLVSVVTAEWVDLGLSDLDHASLEVVECTASGFVVDITLPGFYNNNVTEGGIQFNALSVPAMSSYAMYEGYPALPKASFLAALPDNPAVSIEVEPLAQPVSFHWIKPSPMQPFPIDSSYEPVPFAYVQEAYNEGEYPLQTAAFEEIGVLRGVNIGRFSVMPFNWDADNGTLTVTPKIRITVNLGGMVSTEPRLMSRFFTNAYRTLVNSEVLPEPVSSISVTPIETEVTEDEDDSKDIDAADLLIIAGNGFDETVMSQFIEMKTRQGYLTILVEAGGWNQTQIKNYIQDAYDNWTIPPSFILFVGDHQDLISYNSTITGVYSDNRYVCVDGSDYQADIYHSRFVTSLGDYDTVEGKILKWEFDPLTDPDFWNNGLCAGMLQDNDNWGNYDGIANRWFCFTCEAVRDTYQNIYGKVFTREYVTDSPYSPPYNYRYDLPSAGQQVPLDIVWDGDAAGILASINDGVFLVQHRDHGSVTGWGDPYFTISHFSLINNGDMTPMVMSVNCLTGKFSQDCFAENLFRMEGGAVGVLAATEVSYSYWNDYLCYGLYKSFNDEYTTPPALYTDPTGNYLAAQALMGAKTEMLVAAPFSPYATWEYYAERTYDLFHWFGDPTMDMRTDVPHSLSVTPPSLLPGGSTQAVFYVSDGDGAVDNALVCISHDSLWVSGLTDLTGSVTLTFDPIGGLSDIPWMVTAHNALPAEGMINGVGIGDNPVELITSVGMPRPNPASGNVILPVTLSGDGWFEMTVYDTAGRAVAVVHSGELDAGEHSLVWDTHDVPQGIYMIRSINPSGSVTTSRVVVCK